MNKRSSSIVEFNIRNLGKSVFSKNPKPMADRDSAGLPYTEKEQIKLLQREYENSAARGGRDAVDKCFK